MNFELIDNLFQVIALSTASAAGLFLALRRQDRRLLILAMAYTSFAIGTTYWLLHIAIRGEPPQVFYVPEISWGACYLFYLSLQLLRCEKFRIRFSALALICALAMASRTIWYRILGPSYIFSGAFTVIIGIMTYMTVYRLLHHAPGRAFDVCLLAVMVLQVSLYIVSRYMEDFTRFNPYFAVDLLLTLCAITLLPLILREVDG